MLHHAALIVALAALHAVSYSQPELDTTFNSTGKQTTSFPGLGFGASGMIVQPDNKIILIGAAGNGGLDFTLVRYTESGALDPLFGSGGIVQTNFETGNGNDAAFCTAIQTDGRIVVAGVIDFNANQGSVAIARYNTNGSPDTSFGSGGKVVTSVETFGEDRASALVIQPDGKILIAGSVFVSNFNFQEIVIRYNANGSLDTSFGSGGIVRTQIGGGQGGGNQARAIALQPDNKIVTAGMSRSVGSGTLGDPYLVRYNPDGTRDTSFDGDGIKTLVVSNDDDGFRAVAIQPDGKIVAGGVAGGTDAGFYLVRLNSNGSLDTSFDGDGRAALAMSGEIYSLVISSSGKISAAGLSAENFAIARFTPDGALDTTFSDDGKLLVDVGTASYDYASAVAYDSRGRLVLGGTSASSFAAVRLRAASSVQISGRVTTIEGRPVMNALLFLDLGDGTVRTARTNPFGYYRYSGITPGTYTITVVSKSFSFAPRTVEAFDDLTNYDFVSTPARQSEDFLF